MKQVKNKSLWFLGILTFFGAALLFYGVYVLNHKTEYDLTKVQHPNSYQDLYHLMQSNNTFMQGKYMMDMNLGAETNTTNSKDYSTTNIQVAGVEEADIVKTDGDYIYTLNSEYLSIVKVVDGTMEIASKIKSQETTEDGSSNFSEMYLNGNKLIVIKTTYQYNYSGVPRIMPDYFFGGNSRVSVVIFDISNKSNPIKINELSQSGSYISSRMVDHYLYITTNYYVYGEVVPNDASTFVPTLKTIETKPIAVKDIIIAPNPNSNSYLTVTGIDINNASDFISSKAILGSSSNIYADTNNLYIASYGSETIGNTYTTKTNLLKFSFDKGVLNLVANGSVNGYILNQFSMDEYNGYFRIATTSSDYTYYEDKDAGTASIDIGIDTTKNNLYILDSNLTIAGKLEGLAEKERIYSVRFDQGVAYFVTFRQVDPLFVVDVSNPSDPQIKSQLKIPGFSEYLHVYNDNYLFGLGKEANEEGRVVGLKISMYDIQDKTNVTEKYKLVIGDQYTWSESSYNHKAILVSSDRGLIAFPVNDYYVVYKFTDGVGFEKLGQIDFELSSGLYYYYYGNIRGLYINDFLYAVNENQMKTLNLESLKPGNVLDLSTTDNRE